MTENQAARHLSLTPLTSLTPKIPGTSLFERKNQPTKGRAAWWAYRMVAVRRRANLSPAHFSTLIRQKTGHSPMHWITFITINNAKVLLKNKSLSIKEIAQHLGFPEQFTFRKYFKNATGMSPTEFRESKP